MLHTSHNNGRTYPYDFHPPASAATRIYHTGLAAGDICGGGFKPALARYHFPFSQCHFPSLSLHDRHPSNPMLFWTLGMINDGWRCTVNTKLNGHCSVIVNSFYSSF